jgi:hypothetical protein
MRARRLQRPNRIEGPFVFDSKHKVSQGYSPADLPILAKCEALKTGTMVCFVNVDRIIYSIFQRFNLEWKNRTLKLFTQAA